MEIFVSLSGDATQEVIFVEAGDALVDIENKIAEELGLEVGGFEIHFAGDKLKEVALSGGDELTVYISKKYYAAQQLEERGITPPYDVNSFIRSERVDALKLILETEIELTNSYFLSAISLSAIRSLKVLFDRLESAVAANRATDFIPTVKDEPTLRVLLDAGANPTVVHSSGNALNLTAAMVGDCLELSQLLVEKYSVDMNTKSKSGETAIHSASKEGNLRVLEYLLSEGGNASACNNVGLQPLHFAASRGQLGCVKVLASKSDVNCINNAGNTPLFFASRNSARRVVEYLSTVGADPTIKNEIGNCAYSEASDLAYRRCMIGLFLDFPPDSNMLQSNEAVYTSRPEVKKHLCAFKCVIM